MDSLHEDMVEYKKQLERGRIQRAYKGLLEYMLALRTHFKNKFPEYAVSGNVYFGFMDMTYFSCFPQAIKDRNLKIAIVFLHEQFRFEVWLAGVNKQVQTEYWQLFKASNWRQYPIVPTVKGEDAILTYVLVDDPDFSDLDAITQQIERETLNFIRDVEGFLNQPHGHG